MKKVFTIAEVAQAHDGSLGMAHAYIDALVSRGVDAVKFQIHLAHAESSIHEPFRVKFSQQDATRYEYWQRMSFTKDQWKGIKQHCDDAGIEFMASAFSNEAVDWLEELEVKRYKIGSGEVNNLLMLQKIAQTQKPVILSSGMSSFEELDESVSFLKNQNIEVSVLQCTTAYPTPPEAYGLNVIQELKSRYGTKVGYSDHSGKVSTGLSAVALGAEIVEFHVAFSKEQFGPDSSSSLTLDQTHDLVNGIRDISTALDHPIDKNDNSAFSSLKSIFEKSLAVNKDLPQGHVLSFEDLEAKKPKNHGIAASDFKNVIGKTLKRDMEAWGFLGEGDVE